MEDNSILFAILYGIVGGISCFYGYRLLRIMLALVGFVAGILIALTLLDLFVIETDTDKLIAYAETIDELTAESSIIGIIFTLAVGLVAAVLIQVFYRVGVFVLAGSAASFITFILLSNNTELDDEVRLFAILFAFGVVGIFALRVERQVLVLSTSLLGAFLIILAGYIILIERDVTLDQPLGEGSVGVSVGALMLVAWLLLAIVGAYKQFDDADTLLDGY